jgi:uncharacterized damage-inducible protein DinB
MPESWLDGKLDGYSALLMPAAHALVQARGDLERLPELSAAELDARPGGAPSAAFHLKHIAGSLDRLATYARGGELTAAQFEFLRRETAAATDAETAAELVAAAAREIDKVLEEMKNVGEEILFDPRFVGREKLETNVFGLLFHLAEHTARHVGQVVTTAKIVKNR